MQLGPPLDPAWILYEDEDLVCVNKPEGMPSQAPDASRKDDLVSRLRAFLSARDGTEAYLGVHQRLDKDTSGCVVFTKRKEANPWLAKAFEGRQVEKGYVAAVLRWTGGRGAPASTLSRASVRTREPGGAVTLRDWLAPDTGGRMRVTRPKERGAQEAVTVVRERKRAGERALLELRLLTGRTHQARVQLAHAGAPVAGDRLYGGPLAPRLLLHASRLALPENPRTGKRLSFVAPVPVEFGRWLEGPTDAARVYDDEGPLRAALARAKLVRYDLLRQEAEPRPTTAFRLVNELGDGLPGLVVDVYGDFFVAEMHADDTELHGNEARRNRALDALFALGPTGIYLKVRPKQASTLVDAQKEHLAPRLPVRGEPAPDELEVHEDGIPYAVRLADGLQTGLFLDQRANRGRVQSAARGKRVLNLFSYTCAFSIAAAHGGAARTVSVDASMPALERGRRGFVRAGIALGDGTSGASPERGKDAARHDFAAEDAFAWLRRIERTGERFDLVILDPPSYSSTKKRRFVAKTDYPELAAEAMALVSPGGVLLACANHRGISRQRFRKMLHDAARIAKRGVAQAKDLAPPVDFPVAMGEEPHLKAVWVTLS